MQDNETVGAAVSSVSNDHQIKKSKKRRFAEDHWSLLCDFNFWRIFLGNFSALFYNNGKVSKGLQKSWNTLFYINSLRIFNHWPSMTILFIGFPLKFGFLLFSPVSRNWVHFLLAELCILGEIWWNCKAICVLVRKWLSFLSNLLIIFWMVVLNFHT